MPWLKMRLAVALAALPGTAVAVSACGSKQTTGDDSPVIERTDDQDPVPTIENQPDPVKADDTQPKPELPPLTADEWCGTPTDAWNRSATGDPSQLCPDATNANGNTWSADAANADLRTEATGEPTCCYDRVDNGIDWDDDMVRGVGRLLVVDGRSRVARAAGASAWVPSDFVDSTIASGLSSDVRDELARRWLDNGLLEHASVASFARATIELMAVGAPPSLIGAAQRAAADEVRHAQMCFAIASSYAGTEVGPGPLSAAAPRDLDLAQLAATTFAEGCVPESVGVMQAERAAAHATHLVIQRALREIAEDEARHAELAWSTVGWAVRTGGRPVLDAVIEAARAYQIPGEVAPSPFDDVLAAHGLLTAAEQAHHMRRGWRELIAPLLDDLAAGNAPAHDVA